MADPHDPPANDAPDDVADAPAENEGGGSEGAAPSESSARDAEKHTENADVGERDRGSREPDDDFAEQRARLTHELEVGTHPGGELAQKFSDAIGTDKETDQS